MPESAAIGRWLLNADRATTTIAQLGTKPVCTSTSQATSPARSLPSRPATEAGLSRSPPDCRLPAAIEDPGGRLPPRTPLNPRSLSPGGGPSGPGLRLRGRRRSALDIAVKNKSLLPPSNYSQQDGLLVVELMSRDHGHLPAPSVGERVELTGAWVDDTQHAWNEVHPVFAIRINGGAWHASGPRFGGSPPYTRSDNSLAMCHTAGGARCVGYKRRRRSPTRQPRVRWKHATSRRRQMGPPHIPRSAFPHRPDLDCSEVPYHDFKVLAPDPHHFDSEPGQVPRRPG